MELNKKAAYLQGLVDGLGVDETTKEGKIIKAMSALLGGDGRGPGGHGRGSFPRLRPDQRPER